MNTILLLAQRGANNPANKWLNDNPQVLGLGALLLGAVLAVSGINGLSEGVARDKYGFEFRGCLGKSMSLLRVAFGAAVCAFGVYKLVTG